MKTANKLSIAVLCLVPFAVPAADMRDASEVLKTLSAAGYLEVRDVEYDDGLWEAEVLRADGRWGEVHVDPLSGEVLDERASVPLMDAAAIIAALAATGFTAIQDLDRDGAIWDVEATDAQGQRVELRVSGRDARVLNSDVDRDNSDDDGDASDDGRDD